MKSTEMSNNCKTLKRDYDSCQCPRWDDPMTLRTLECIVHEIESGRTKWRDVQDYIEAEIGPNEFGRGCLRYIRTNISHQSLIHN